MLTIGDIMTREIVYYDPSHEKACADFCRERKVYYMPSPEDDYVYYQIQPDGSFLRRELVDPSRKAELVTDVIYKLNGELIRRLRNLTAEKVGLDTYSSVSEEVISAGNRFKSTLKEMMRERSLINSQLINEIVGAFVKTQSQELLRRVRKRMPPNLTDEDWEEVNTNFLNQIDSDIIYSITPILVYNTRRELIDKLKVVHPSEGIFKEDVYEKLRYNSLLFVMDQGMRVGMVHFSDYNRLPVFTHTFNRLHNLEREMVKALLPRKLQVKDVWRIGGFNPPPIPEREVRNLTERKGGDGDAYLRYHDLEKFYLKTLLVLYNYTRENEELPYTPIRNPNTINLLRNRVAHSNDLVELVDTSRSNLIYDFKSFAAFFRQQRALDLAVKQIFSHNFFTSLEELEE
jgi:hypothetical protein